MPQRKRTLIQKRNEAIKADYQRLKAQKKYTAEHIFEKILEPKYYISAATLMKIVYGG
jgi:hypothetical protein